MPIVKTIEDGDLIELTKSGEFDGMIHGCNCFHTMGAGIAAAVSSAFPEAFKSDLDTIYGDSDKLGTLSYAVSAEYGIIIANMYTQYNPGRCPDYTLYSAILSGFHVLNNENPGLTFGIPKIGCGIAGGDWDLVSAIINKMTPKVDLVLVLPSNKALKNNWRK